MSIPERIDIGAFTVLVIILSPVIIPIGLLAGFFWCIGYLIEYMDNWLDWLERCFPGGEK